MARAIIDGMNVKIDKAGRIVLPKQVRNRLQLRAGTNLELEERPEGLVLRPVGQRPSIIQKDGVWVHLGKLPTGLDWDRILDDDRDDRVKDIAGL
ncbi:MAG TPA: AbrB/MazE/SpoVT family DNA-binding domain-containing protein [Candidatus Angelobacter sp.]|nr:AbrB/MazE/SpoVT family DNA-binding domain-containing protein [Candidatus Angelobacter sp.]